MRLASDDAALLARYVDVLCGAHNSADAGTGPRRGLTCRELEGPDFDRLRSVKLFSKEALAFFYSNTKSFKFCNYDLQRPTFFSADNMASIHMEMGDIPPVPFEVVIAFSSHDIKESNPTKSYCVSFKATSQNCPELKGKRSVVVRSDEANDLTLTLCPQNDKEGIYWQITCTLGERSKLNPNCYKQIALFINK
eukprot:PhM_4_TR14246/c1_g3_i1/m.63036